MWAFVVAAAPAVLLAALAAWAGRTKSLSIPHTAQPYVAVRRKPRAGNGTCGFAGNRGCNSGCTGEREPAGGDPASETRFRSHSALCCVLCRRCRRAGGVGRGDACRGLHPAGSHSGRGGGRGNHPHGQRGGRSSARRYGQAKWFFDSSRRSRPKGRCSSGGPRYGSQNSARDGNGFSSHCDRRGRHSDGA